MCWRDGSNFWPSAGVCASHRYKRICLRQGLYGITRPVCNIARLFPHLMIDDLTRSCSLSVCLISAERNNEVLWLAGLIFDLSTVHFFQNKRRGIFPSLDQGVCVCVRSEYYLLVLVNSNRESCFECDSTFPFVGRRCIPSKEQNTHL